MPSPRPPELTAPLPAEAVDAWELACARRPPAPPSTVPVEEALGLVTAAPVRALRSSPAFPVAAMDGIAVLAADVEKASAGAALRLDTGDFDVVDTGDPLPAGRDAVIPYERIDLARGSAVVTAASGRGSHVRGVGEDVAAGELLFAPGHRLGPIDLAMAAAAGHADVAVRPTPTVAILPTGDELRPAGAELAPGELADSNSIMLEAQAREAGCRTVRWPILPDDPERLSGAVREAAARCDLVLVSAGTSAGRHDHAPNVLRACGRIVVRGVAMRPGHPAMLAVVDGTPVMGCPGYPVSAAVAFDELARPLLARMSGTSPQARYGVAARLAIGLASRAGARERLRVALGSVHGNLVAVPLRRGASVLSSLSLADGLITVPSDAEALGPGAPVTVEGVGKGEPARSVLMLAGSPDRALEVVALVCAGRGVKVARCEMAPAEALGLVAAGGCHAAWLVGPAPQARDRDGLLIIDVAERDVGLAVASGNPLGVASVADLWRGGVRAVAGPAAWEEVPSHVTRMRSDEAALAAVIGRHADCAMIGLYAARAAGLETLAARRSRVALAVRHDTTQRDAALRTLLETLDGESLGTALRAEGYEPLARTRWLA